MNLFKFKTMAKDINKIKKNRNIKKRERENPPGLTWRSPGSPAGPASARPVTVQPSCQSSSSPSPRSSCVLDARAPTPATSCFVPEASPSSLSMRGDATQPPGAVQPFLSSLELSPLPWLSLPRCSQPHRTAPTLPTSTTAAIASPSSSRAVQELRHDLLFIFAETNDAGAPRSTVIVVAFVLCTDSRRRRFAATRPPPTSPTTPSDAL